MTINTLLVLLATICLNGSCKDVVVTTSATDPRLTPNACSVYAMQTLPTWLGEHYPGYDLGGWKCVAAKGERGA
jgi:hypothetical protein